MEMIGRKSKGFTIIELLVVILILSLLAVFVAPKFFKQVSRAKRDLAIPRMKIVESGIERFSLNCGRLPASLDELLVEPSDFSGTGKWSGPYLKKSELLDPWGNGFIYVEQGQANPGSYDLISFGADGLDGGDGDNADIYNE